MRKLLEFFKYAHLPGYLHRWKLLSMGPLMLRLHRIKSADETPYLHTHPFHYISFVLKGGYTERRLLSSGKLEVITHAPGALIIRRSSQAHRIDSVNEGCLTFFIAWRRARVPGVSTWQLLPHADIETPAEYLSYPDGLYEVSGRFQRREEGMWYVAGDTLKAARATVQLSIHQQVRQAVLVESLS